MKANFAKMSEKNIKSVSENVAKAMGSLKETSAYMGTVQGALAVITKFWNKNNTTKVGFNEIVNALGLPYAKPSELSKAVLAMYNKFEGVNPLLVATETKNVKGEEVEIQYLGVWSSKSLVNERAEAVYDAKGKATYPYVVAKGDKDETQPVKVDSIKAIKKWTPELVFKVLIQNEALKGGTLVPFTADEFWAKVDEGTYVLDGSELVATNEAAPVDAPAPAPVETPAPVAEAPTAPTPAKGGKRGKKNAA